MPTKDELLAHDRNLQKMCEYLNANTLKYISLDWIILQILSMKKEIQIFHNLAIIILQVIIQLLLTMKLKV